MRRACGLDDLDRVPVRPAPRWLRRLWVGPVAAMTLPWGVYVDPAVLAGDSRRLGLLLGHELTHVRQWREMGSRRFLLRYLGEYLSARRRGLPHAEAYRSITLEAEAREVESRLA